jgi:hypothetical protein
MEALRPFSIGRAWMRCGWGNTVVTHCKQLWCQLLLLWTSQCACWSNLVSGRVQSVGACSSLVQFRGLVTLMSTCRLLYFYYQNEQWESGPHSLCMHRRLPLNQAIQVRSILQKLASHLIVIVANRGHALYLVGYWVCAAASPGQQLDVQMSITLLWREASIQDTLQVEADAPAAPDE